LHSGLQIDAFTLLNNSFGGSGYDIACAQNNCFTLSSKKPNIVDKVSFNPGSKKTFILFILTKNKVAKQQLQTIKITKRKI
jgi:hypothetical protein